MGQRVNRERKVSSAGGISTPQHSIETEPALQGTSASCFQMKENHSSNEKIVMKDHLGLGIKLNFYSANIRLFFFLNIPSTFGCAVRKIKAGMQFLGIKSILEK